jgi:integrase
MPGKTYHPLDTAGQYSEVDQFRDAAIEGDPLDTLVGLTLIDTGIRCSAMSHMRGGWLRLHGSNPQLKVPRTETCTLGTGEGKGGDTTDPTEPCYQCRMRPVKDWLIEAEEDADWHPKSEAGANRVIPIRDEDTKRILEDYFRVHETVAGVDTVKDRVREIGNRAGLDRDVTPHDLRDTYGTRLAVKGFSPYDIKDFMGHSDLDQALDYIKLSGAQAHEAYDDKW